jgi:hypothetical protein
MPIRPEDFDASPAPRAAPIAPAPPDPNAGVERRWFQELSQRQVTWLLLAVSTIGLALFAVEKPLTRWLHDLVHPTPPTIEVAEEAPHPKDVPSAPVPPPPPEAIPPEHDQLSESTSSAEHPLEIPPPKDNTKPPQRRIKKYPAENPPPPDDQAQKAKQELERQQADLAAQQKQLSEAQAALEEQRQSALVNPLPPSNEPLGLNDVEIYVKLMSPISTRTSSVGDGISAQVLTPPYTGAIIQGRIVTLKTDKNGKKAEMTFQFETLTFHNATYRIQADLKEFSNSHGTGNADEQGQVLGKTSKKKNVKVAGADKGGVFGAAMRDAKGAAIGTSGAKEVLFIIKLTARAAEMHLAPGSLFTLRVSDSIPR